MIDNRLTFRVCMLDLEVMQVLQIFLISGRLFVFRQFVIVFLLGCLSFSLVWILFSLSQALPIFSNKLSDLGEGQVLAFEILSHLCTTVRKSASLHFENESGLRDDISEETRDGRISKGDEKWQAD